ncbi:MAG TPA: TerB family tellurite resistance protein [Candidatus Sulfomarinibacteraceae bacterium]|nr:TerB family tellurite resistance protein [Candidatus Sulfomarinibacteraceae bacterium]
MQPASVPGSEPSRIPDPAAVVRRTVRQLDELDADTADHLAALAFVMMRVAHADGSVSDDERARMEALLVEHAAIPPEHAVLVTEIARHRAALADCGCSYATSRGIRNRFDAQKRRSVLGLLRAVAGADGHYRTVEERQIQQIAREIGIATGDGEPAPHASRENA